MGRWGSVWVRMGGTEASDLTQRSPPPMTHRNAPLTPEGRLRLIERVQAAGPIAHVAAEAGIARATVSKWVARYRIHGEAGLQDRSSARWHRPTQTPPEVVDLIENLAPHPQVVRPPHHPRAPCPGYPDQRANRHPLAGPRRTEPAPPHRPHRSLQPRHWEDPRALPGPHGPPRRQESREDPTGWRLASPRARKRQDQGIQARCGQERGLHLPAHRHRRLLPPGLHGGAGRTRRPRPPSASSAAPGPSSPPTASPGSCA